MKYFCVIIQNVPLRENFLHIGSDLNFRLKRAGTEIRHGISDDSLCILVE